MNMQSLTYADIVKLEPRILEAEALAQELAGSPTYGLWYSAVKPAFKFLVGILSAHSDPRLRTSEAYDIVYARLLALYEAQPTDGVMPPPVAAPTSPSPADQGKRICSACGQDMRDAESCGGPLIQIAGRVYERVRFGQERGTAGRSSTSAPNVAFPMADSITLAATSKSVPGVGGNICPATAAKKTTAPVILKQFRS